MSTIARRAGTMLAGFILAAPALLASSCGGGAGPGSGGLILISFTQTGQDNVPLNRILEFVFSGAVDPDSVFVLDPQGKQRSTGAIQIREGSAFGVTAEGTFEVAGATVFFRPTLPGQCDRSDAGLRPGTRYRVTLVGFPEAFSVRGAGGQPLDQTSTHEFITRPEDDPNLLEDQLPTASPFVVTSTPADGTAAVDVALDDPSTPSVYEGNEVRIRLSENLDPCSVSNDTVLIHEYARGAVGTFVAAPNGNFTGFNPPTDQAPGDATDWGSGTPLATPQRVRSVITLEQDFDDTFIVIRPAFTAWPDNALIVVELTFGIADFGGQPLVPVLFAFTTENLPPQAGTMRLMFDGETPFDPDSTTADVNTSRAISRVQGYLLFSGDGDNGANQLVPTLPNIPAGCTIPRQINDGTKDHFDPAADVLLDTGASVNTCANSTDGSRAVVWEFATFRIRTGVTVRVIGVNCAIVLVQGGVVIENGARLLLRGDGAGGAPQGRGGAGSATTNNGAAGGVGVAGGGSGGQSPSVSGTYPARYGDHGVQGYYHGTGGAVGADVGLAPGTGGGHANTSALWSSQTNPNNRNTPSGGGGGHAAAGGNGTALGSGSAPTALDLTPDGAGGGTYGAASGSMPTAEAGSGGGAAGEIRPFSGNAGRGPGGAGGAGGGFIDLTAGADILIQGTVDAAGAPGGAGATQPFNPNYTWQPGSGGGGGGSGGGVRMLTPGAIVFAPTAVVTAAGGAGGVGGDSQGAQPPRNNGGVGGVGRIVLEDGDSVIAGLGSATVIPGEGAPGFYRGTFDAARFQGGGITPEGLTEILFAGPNNPTYLVPGQADFSEPPAPEAGSGSPGAAIPAVTARGNGTVGIIIEARAYPILPDGEPDLLSPTAFYTVGYFTDSTVPDLPNWRPSPAFPWPAFDPLVGPRPADNAGDGFDHPALMGKPFLQFRFRFFLPNGVGPFDEGPFVNDWIVRFTYNQ